MPYFSPEYPSFPPCLVFPAVPQPTGHPWARSSFPCPISDATPMDRPDVTQEIHQEDLKFKKQSQPGHNQFKKVLKNSLCDPNITHNSSHLCKDTHTHTRIRARFETGARKHEPNGKVGNLDAANGFGGHHGCWSRR